MSREMKCMLKKSVRFQSIVNMKQTVKQQKMKKINQNAR